MATVYSDQIQGVGSDPDPVDAITGNGETVAYKAPVRVATTDNITRSGLQTIDGVSVVANDRVLVKDQSNAEDNGIYIASTGAWARSRDFNSNRDVTQGTRVSVNQGTVNGGKTFSITTANPIVVGTTELAFSSDLFGVDRFDVSRFGAVGDGSTDDSAAIQAAIDAATAAGGGVVLLPPTGFPYVIETGLSITHGVVLQGVSGRSYWADFNAPPTDWGRYGTWIWVKDTTNPAVTMDAPGKVKDINFIYEQPAPTGAVWTPTTFPYTIEVNWILSAVEGVMIIGGTHGINLNYPESGLQGTYTVLRDLWLSTYTRGIRFKSCNDTVTIDNVRHRNLLYIGFDEVDDYIYANKVDWDINYLDNLEATNVEFYQSFKSMLFTDAQADYGLGTIEHAASHLQLTNISFNQVYQAISLAASDTEVSFHGANWLIQTDTDNGQAAAWAFDLNSDNVFGSITGIWAGYIGKGFMRLGAGTGGRVEIANLHISEYAQLGGGEACFNLAAGSVLDIPTGIQNITGDIAGGAIFTGSGSVAYLITGNAHYSESFIQARRSGNYPSLQTNRYDAHGSAAYIGAYEFYGKDSADNVDTFAQIAAQCVTHTSGAESSQIEIRRMWGGAWALALTVGDNVVAGTGLKSNHATRGLGYDTGAGGTVTQATSKSTGVTLNKVCGQITTNNATLNAGAEVTFTVTNSAVAATDVPVAAIVSGGTAGAYHIGVTAVGSGSFAITITNLSGSNLGEALVINFVIIKAVAA